MSYKELTEEECIPLGCFKGAGTTCPVLPGVPGACCLDESRECRQTSREYCDYRGDVWGDSSADCERACIGACHSQTLCHPTPIDICLPGLCFAGVGATCPRRPGTLGACCFDDSRGCERTRAGYCSCEGGDWQGGGTVCPTVCTKGACCSPPCFVHEELSEPRCGLVRESRCPGCFAGRGTECEPEVDCCLPNGDCLEMAEKCCMLSEGCVVSTCVCDVFPCDPCEECP